jgi:hypothetical protein
MSISTEERIINYLKKSGTWVTVLELVQAAEIAGIGRGSVIYALGALDKKPNIGRKWSVEQKSLAYHYYEPREGDDLMQRALNEF